MSASKPNLTFCRQKRCNKYTFQFIFLKVFSNENILQRDIKDILVQSISLRHHCDFRIYVTGMRIMRGLSWTSAFWNLNYAIESNQCLAFSTSFNLQQINRIKITGKLSSRSLFNITLFHVSLINFQNIKQLHFMTFEGLVVKYDWSVGGLTFI